MDGAHLAPPFGYDADMMQSKKRLYASHLPVGTPITSRRRLNFVAIGLNVLGPWLVFILTVVMLSFTMHFRVPNVCYVIVAVAVVTLSFLCLVSLLAVVRRQLFPIHYTSEAPSWVFFFTASTLIALLLGWSVGSQNYMTNTRAYYVNDVMSTYEKIDPATMHGQEVMDAGSVVFTNTTKLDVSKAMGFKNSIIYCVAPIATGDSTMANYDFWAVGTNCCKDSGAHFKCGDHGPKKKQNAGLRLVSDDEERSFYRLAVQQALSVHSIKSTHPLFFQWVEDPQEEMRGHRRRGYKTYLLSTFAYFGIQSAFVFVFATLFRKSVVGDTTV